MAMKRSAILAWALTALTAGNAVATELTGRVLDPAHHPIVGAVVSITSADPAGDFRVRTDEWGGFRFSGVPGGTYSLEVLFVGFLPLRENLRLGADRISRDFVLSVADLGGDGVTWEYSSWIGGVIQNVNGPLPGARLCLEHVSNAFLNKCVIADERARVGFAVLPGRYWLSVINDGRTLWRYQVNLEPNGYTVDELLLAAMILKTESLFRVSDISRFKLPAPPQAQLKTRFGKRKFRLF